MNLLSELWRLALMPSKATIGEAVLNLNQTGLRIILIADDNDVLLGTVSDGDIRRGLLKGLNLSSPVSEIIHKAPLVVTSGMNKDLVIQLMAVNKIHQIPIVGEDRRIVGLHLWDEISVIDQRENFMVIMAGGLGKRLHPQTEKCPKPMILIAGKPMLEHIINNAKLAGFYRFIVSVNYLGHIIKDYFDDGSQFGVEITYLNESEPLGTAGALSLIDPLPKYPIVVTNGDVISDIRYSEMLDFHIANSAYATMALRAHELQIPYGVVQTKGIEIVGFEEKPILHNNINAGVYVIDHKALNLLQIGAYCDMPTLFESLRNKSMRVIAYPIHEPWLDVGRPEDLRKASAVIQEKN